MENDVVEHGKSAESKTQSLMGFYTAATKIMLDNWSSVNWSHTVTKTTKISKTTKLQQGFKFAIIDNNKVLTFGQVQQFQPVVIFFS